MASASTTLMFDEALVVEQWLHRVESDTSGLTFEEWNPKKEELEPNAQPAFMIANSCEVRGAVALGLPRDASADFREIFPAGLAAVTRGPGSRTRAALKKTYSNDPRSFVLHESTDNRWRDLCE